MKKKMTILMVASLFFGNASSLLLATENVFADEQVGNQANDVEEQNSLSVSNNDEQVVQDTVIAIPSEKVQVDDNKEPAKSSRAAQDYVSIPDAVLLKAIKSALSLEFVDQLTEEQLTRLNVLSIQSADGYNGLKDLTGLEYGVNLTKMDISGQPNLTTLMPVANLKQLTTLNVTDSGIASLDGVSQLTQLEKLQLSGNHITDWSGLSELTNLKEFTYDSYNWVPGSNYTVIEDITPFLNLKSLISLDLSNNAISDLSPLDGNNQLVTINLDNNLVTNITPLTTMTALNFLSVNNNNLNNIDDLATLSGVSEIRANQNHIYDLNKIKTMFETMPMSATTSSLQLNNQTITLPTVTVVEGQTVSSQNPTKDINNQSMAITTISDSGTSEDNQSVIWQNITTDKNLTYQVSYTSTNEQGVPLDYSATITQPVKIVAAGQTIVNVHDSTLYTGDNWSAQDNFDNAIDKEGKPVDFEKIEVTGTVDTSKAGTYPVNYSYDGVEATATITVKDKQTTVNVHDSTLYTGDDWSAQDNFDNAIDKEGKPVDFEKIEVTGTVDTSKAGTYPVNYSYDGVEATATITVKDKQTTVNVHDSTLYTGDDWSAQDNFDNATDKEGKPVDFEKVEVMGTVDTSKAGTYPVNYSYDGIEATAMITVKERENLRAKDVLINYVDQDGKIVHEAQKVSGNIGEKYDFTSSKYQLTIEGYSLTKVPTNVTGTFSEKEQVVTFVYKKIMSNQPSIPPINMDKENPNSSSKLKQNENVSVLPKTGEYQSNSLWLIGGILMISGIYVFVRRWRKS
ncbi:bacterial Ig-like domain-containing protein [Enterococcus sp. C71]|uniref:bacterial Ig-like domain-containing protein n=1 Tax=Enterococcus sp. C71 TaxID=3231329 RepID=UPI0034A09909